MFPQIHLGLFDLMSILTRTELPSSKSSIDLLTTEGVQLCEQITVASARAPNKMYYTAISNQKPMRSTVICDHILHGNCFQPELLKNKQKTECWT